jgi:hypothetical protein
MRKSRVDYTRANRIAWNEAATRHAAHNNAELFAAFKDPNHVTFQGDILETSPTKPPLGFVMVMQKGKLSDSAAT